MNQSLHWKVQNQNFSVRASNPRPAPLGNERLHKELSQTEASKRLSAASVCAPGPGGVPVPFERAPEYKACSMRGRCQRLGSYYLESGHFRVSPPGGLLACTGPPSGVPNTPAETDTRGPTGSSSSPAVLSKQPTTGLPIS